MAEKRTIIDRLLGRNKPKDDNIQQLSEAVVTGPKPQVSDNIVTSLKTSSIEVAGTIDALTADERTLRELYLQMDQDSIISAALDLLADNATIVDKKTGRVAAVTSNDISFQEEINDFLWNIFEVDIKAWQLVRAVARDGKVVLDTEPNPGSQEWSFIEVENPANIQALVSGDDKVRYFAVAPEANEEKPDSIYSLYNRKNQAVSNYTIEPSDRFIIGFNNREIHGTMVVRTTSELLNDDTNTYEEVLKIRTGRSVLAPVISTWQMLNTMENAMYVNRLTKATQFKIVSVDVSDANNAQATKIINDTKNAFKNTETIDRINNRYMNRVAPVTVDDMIFIATKGSKGSVNIVPVGGEMSEAPMNDINYMRNKLFAGLGVLKSYLGFEEETPGGLGDATLTKLDERLGRRVQRLQQVLKHILKDVIEYYWKYSSTDRTIENMPDYEIVLGKVSTKEDQDARDTLSANFDIANNLMSLVKDEMFADKVDTEKLFKYVFGEVLNLDISKFDAKPEAADIMLTTKQVTPFEEHIKKHLDGLYYEAVGKLSDFVTKEDMEKLLSDTTVVLKQRNGKTTNLLEAVKLPRYSVLTEATHKELKQKSLRLDPERLAKAKRITVKYIGLDEDNNIVFTASAENPAKNKAEGKPTSYTTKVSLLDLANLLKEQGKMKDKDIVMRALQGDIKVFSNDPSFRYWGTAYNGTKEGYSMVKETRPPKRNIPTQVITKHLIATLTALPFWWNTIVRDLRRKGDLDSSKNKVKKIDKKDFKELDES